MASTSRTRSTMWSISRMRSMVEGLWRASEGHELRAHPALGDAQLGRGDRQLEAARAGAARVHVKYALALFDFRLVRMPGDHHARSPWQRQVVQVMHHVD